MFGILSKADKAKIAKLKSDFVSQAECASHSLTAEAANPGLPSDFPKEMFKARQLLKELRVFELKTKKLTSFLDAAQYWLDSIENTDDWTRNLRKEYNPAIIDEIMSENRFNYSSFISSTILKSKRSMW